MTAPRLAFLLLAHGDPAHLRRLCLRIAGHAVFVHVDAKADPAVADAVRDLGHVTLVTPAVSVHWADWSMVEATIRLCAAALRDPRGLERFVLLSGGCYPVKPVAALTAAFAAEPEREWIALTPITDRDGHLGRLVGRHWRLSPLLPAWPRGDRLARTLLNKLARLRARDIAAETGLPPMFGSQWWALTRASVGHVLDALGADPAVARAYRSAYAPDEHVFHTLVAASPRGRHAIAVPDLGPATNQHAPLHLIHPSHERRFSASEADFTLARDTDRFFIRKVSDADAGALLDRIDRELLGLR